jgi:O-antigen/teichoic acid export membrane protein
MLKTKILSILRTTTIRQSLITTISIVVNGVLATVFYLSAAKVLGAHDYGLFSLSAVTVAIMSVVFDFGNDKGVVKFVSKYGPKSDKSYQILKAVLLTKLLSGVVFIILFSIFSRPLANLIFNQPEMSGLLPLTAFAFFTQLLLFFVTYYFQAAEKFLIWGFLFVNANLIRLILMFVVYASGLLNAYTTLFLFAITPLISFIIGLYFMKLDFLKIRIEWSIFKELFSFNKWAFGFSSVSSIGSRLDTFLSSQYLSLSAVGAYGLATQATLIMPNLVSALGAVSGPKFARFRNHKDNSSYLSKSTLFFTAIAIICGIILIPMGYLFMRFSGSNYLTGFIPSIILILSQVIFLAFSPLRDSLLYYYSRPDFIFWISIGHSLVTLISGLILLPIYGLVGAAISNLLGQAFLNLISGIMYLHLRRTT